MAEKGQIIIPITFDVTANGAGSRGASFQGQGVPNTGAGVSGVPKSNDSFLQGISAQMLMENFTRILSATGNTQLASSISKVSSYGFLAGRVIASGGMNIGADITLVSRLIADVMQMINEEKEQRMKTAEAYNETDILRMRSGIIQFNANTVISYDKYKRFKLAERR